MIDYLDFEQRILNLIRQNNLTLTLGSLQNQRIVLGGVRGSGGGVGGPIQPFVGKLTQTDITFDVTESGNAIIPAGQAASLLHNLNRIRVGQTIKPSYVPANYTVTASGNLNQHLEGIDTALLTAGGGGSGHVIQDEGVSLPQRTKLNFTGAGVTVTDDSGNNQTDVTIPAGNWPYTDILTVDTSGSGAYTSIGAAITGASDGQSILINSETYNEALTFNKSLQIRGTGQRRAIINNSTAGNFGTIFLSGASKEHQLTHILTKLTASTASSNAAALSIGTTDSFTSYIEDCEFNAVGAGGGTPPGPMHAFRANSASGTKTINFKGCTFIPDDESGSLAISIVGTDTITVVVEGGLVSGGITLNNANATLELRGGVKVTGTVTITAGTARGQYQDGSGETKTLTGWNAWTPTVTQGVSVTLTANVCKYKVVNKICHLDAVLTITSAGTGGSDIIIGGQPAAIRGVNAIMPLGFARVNDTGTANYVGILFAEGTTDWRVIINQAGYVGSNPSFALANGDLIYFNGTYEVT